MCSFMASIWWVTIYKVSGHENERTPLNRKHVSNFWLVMYREGTVWPVYCSALMFHNYWALLPHSLRNPSWCAVKNVSTLQPHFKCRLLILSVQSTPSNVTRVWHPTKTTATDRAPLPVPSTPTPVPPSQDQVSDRTLDCMTSSG